MTKATSQVTTQVEIKWFYELDEGDRFSAYLALHFLEQDLLEEFVSDPCRVEACLSAFSENVIEVCNNPDAYPGLKDDFRVFVDESNIIPWIDPKLERVSHGEPLMWYFLVPTKAGYKFPTNAAVFLTNMVRLVAWRLEGVWWQRKSNDLMRLTDKNYKTPRQFSEDTSIPLREVNRRIKNEWGFFENKLGSIKLVFPGADPLILLSPKTQEYLGAFATNTGIARTMIDMSAAGKRVTELVDHPLFN